MSGRKNVLPSYKFWDGASMAASLTGADTDITGIDNVVIYLTYTGTPTGTFDIQTSPDKGATWFSLTLSGSPAAAGSGDSIEISLNQLGDNRIRAVYTRSSGTGTINGWITGKAV